MAQMPLRLTCRFEAGALKSLPMKLLVASPALLLAVALGLAAPMARAQAGSDLLATLLDTPGSAGFGAVTTWRPSHYAGGGTGRDLLPLYLYEGERLFLRGDRIGLKFEAAPAQRVELFLKRRLEGFPLDRVPAALQGMALRRQSADVGIGYRMALPAGSLHAALTQDIGAVSKGHELSLSYHHSWRSGRWLWRRGAGLA